MNQVTVTIYLTDNKEIKLIDIDDQSLDEKVNLVENMFKENAVQKIKCTSGVAILRPSKVSAVSISERVDEDFSLDLPVTSEEREELLENKDEEVVLTED